MTVLHAGGKFDKDTYKVSGGLHGVGVSCVNALSEVLTATVHREGKIFEQTYRRGIPDHDVKEIGKTKERGTIVTFSPDKEIFTSLEYKYDTVASRLRELSFLNAGIKIELKDKRELDENNEPKSEVFYSEGGLTEFVNYLEGSREKLIPNPIYMEGKKENFPVQVALSYNMSYSENVVSYVNNINTIEGGTHVAGFRRGLTRTLKSYAEKSGQLDKVKVDISGDDFREGLTAVISIKVAEPQFEGQTKTKLGNSEAMGAVDVCVGEMLGDFLEENPKEAKQIISKVILAAQARHAEVERVIETNAASAGDADTPQMSLHKTTANPVFADALKSDNGAKTEPSGSENPVRPKKGLKNFEMSLELDFDQTAKYAKV